MKTRKVGDNFGRSLQRSSLFNSAQLEFWNPYTKLTKRKLSLINQRGNFIFFETSSIFISDIISNKSK